MNRTKTVQLKMLPAGLLILAMAALSAWGQDAPTTQPTAAPVFTEDFESGALNPEIWAQRLFPPTTQPASVGPTITVQSDVVAHGKYALLVHYPSVPRSYAFIVANHLPDLLKDHFFGRAYVQFPKAPPNAHDVFITAGSAGWPTSNFLEIGLRQNKAQLSYQQNGKDVTRGEQMYAGPAYPVGKWFCLEWEFNDNPDSITIWIDGEKVTDTKVAYKGTADHLVKGFVDFGFGFRSWGKVPNGFDVYYDDIAIGAERIGPVK